MQEEEKGVLPPIEIVLAIEIRWGVTLPQSETSLREKKHLMFAIGPKYQLEQASHQHILDCLELNREDIHDSPPLVSDFIKVKDFTDLV
ncbi:hypothetical protein TNIN_123611 [Trichonephila inaurata madagascariensis]|uniref:Uncharacterized protein n=1 Tax=Trichonephila inaurata madagascariensis TaxID=2747483 RepID=A0A8X6XS86_9ARAC|nr:hypothetical protein TNIN_123611 [Trichonephila inaurata madagascariensis]